MKAKEIESEIVTFKVTADFKKKLQAMADKDNRSVSNYIKNILEQAMQVKK